VQYPEHLVQDLQTLENIPVTADKGPGKTRVALLRDVATVKRTQGPVEVFHYEADSVSQLFITVRERDLGGVAAEIDRIVEQLPFTYALTILPRDTLLAHALKVFPKDKGDARQDPELQRLLKEYFHDEDPEVAEDLREQYGVNVDALNLGKDEHFRERLGPLYEPET